jgi:hypothetical protein
MPAAFLQNSTRPHLLPEGTQDLEPEWTKILREHAGVLRLLKAFAKIKDKEVRRDAVKLAERIAGIKPRRRKRRPK